MFFCFLSFIFSATGYYNIYPIDRICFLTSFGFTSNSRFSFQLTSKQNIKLALFLFNLAQLRNTTSTEIRKACNNTNKEIIPLNKTFLEPKTFFSWSGQIENKDIYYPIVILCSSYNNNLRIDYQYLNDAFLVDFRSLSFSRMYLIFTAANLCLVVIWILNLLFKPHFSIPIHFLMTLLPMLRALSNSLSAYIWELKKITDDLPKLSSFFSSLSSFLFYLMFSFVTTLSFSGYCVIRTNANINEISQIGLSCLLFVGGTMMSIHSSYFFNSMMPILLTSTGFMWYMKINTTYLATLIQLAQSNLQSPRMIDRVRMVSNFTLASFGLIGFSILVISISMTINSWPIAQMSIMESCIFLLECLDAYFFLVRNEYQGEIPQDVDDSLTAVYMKDPKTIQLVILTKDKENDLIML